MSHKYPSSDHLKNLHWLNHPGPLADPTLHDTDQNTALVRHVARDENLKPDPNDMVLTPSQEDQHKAAEKFTAWHLMGKSVIGFHVTSYPDMTYKRWEGKKFHDLMKRLLEQDWFPIVFGTKNERPYIEEVVKALPVIISTDTPFMETAALVGKCDYFISNDSGLMHLATCMHVPTLGLFGPTNHIRTTPFGPQHKVFRLGLECSPCHNYPFTDSPLLAGCDHISCMNDMTVDHVFTAFQELVAENTVGRS